MRPARKASFHFEDDDASSTRRYQDGARRRIGRQSSWQGEIDHHGSRVVKRGAERRLEQLIEWPVCPGHRDCLVESDRDSRRDDQWSLHIAANAIDVVEHDRSGYVGHRSLRRCHRHVRPFLALLLVFRYAVDSRSEQISVARLSEPPGLRYLPANEGLRPLIARIRKE